MKTMTGNQTVGGSPLTSIVWGGGGGGGGGGGVSMEVYTGTVIDHNFWVNYPL